MAVGRSADYGNQTPEIWAADTFDQSERTTFWHRWEGEPESGMPLIRYDELENEPGDTIRFDISLNLTGAGQTGDSALLDGNEEKLRFRQASFTVESLAHAVRWTHKVHHTITHNMRETAKNKLGRWYAGKTDDDMFSALASSSLPDINKWAAGTAAARADVANTDAGGRLRLVDVSELKAFFKTEIRAEPLRLQDGMEIYGMVLHPYTALALKIHDDDWAAAQKEAQVRGAGNPVFTGALGMWDGVVFYESDRVPRSTNGTINVADNILFGANAASRGWAYYPDWVEQEFSYGQEIGIGSKGIYGQAVNKFDLNATETSADATDDTAIGSMVVYAAAVAPSA